jgi:2-isopropylmalate synthase
MNPRGKYQSFTGVQMDSRDWPSKQITKSPIWCSVDLRDGNQALAVPMTVSQKIRLFKTLVDCGFKEIEVGFPSSSPTEYAFVRRLIDEKIIPDDVTIQVLVPAREDLIKQTIKSLIGAKRVIIHLYNSTSPVQRRLVFKLEKSEIIALAIQGVKWIKQYSAELQGTEILLQYSPESFSATEVEFSLQICEAVLDTWQPTPEQKMIINLPETVEVAMPNFYADQVEWFGKHLEKRSAVIISVHTHNDRGTSVAATELAILAGADRVEGTLFGNGERTGNLDIVTVALNLFTQGIDPNLDFSKLESIRETYEMCTGMTVPSRQPYSGELVLTAFSGSHQDAISKGLKARKDSLLQGKQIPWDIPYLPIDPTDIGRRYNEVIRVNSQSGKGGIAYLLEQECNIFLPKDMQREFSSVISRQVDALGRETTSAELRAMLWHEYIDRTGRYQLEHFSSLNQVAVCECQSVIKVGEEEFILAGRGNGPIHAFLNSLQSVLRSEVKLTDQSEHTLNSGSDASAMAFVQLEFPNNRKCWGAGVDTNIELASIKAVISALNRE